MPGPDLPFIVIISRGPNCHPRDARPHPGPQVSTSARSSGWPAGPGVTPGSRGPARGQRACWSPLGRCRSVTTTSVPGGPQGVPSARCLWGGGDREQVPNVHTRQVEGEAALLCQDNEYEGFAEQPRGAVSCPRVQPAPLTVGGRSPSLWPPTAGHAQPPAAPLRATRWHCWTHPVHPPRPELASPHADPHSALSCPKRVQPMSWLSSGRPLGTLSPQVILNRGLMPSLPARGHGDHPGVSPTWVCMWGSLIFLQPEGIEFLLGIQPPLPRDQDGGGVSPRVPSSPGVRDEPLREL